MSRHVVHHGDCVEVMAGMDAKSVDAVVTDPPYGLSFMGKGWDHGVPGVEFWTEAMRVAKPGAHLLAFGGTRTYHRLACAIEDAGWEIRDCVMWVYGSGFPKSHDVSKAIDKAAGAEREVVGSKLGQPGYHLNGHDGGACYGGGIGSSTNETRLLASQITAPATDAARQWQGWGTALKPAWEPIIVARKPLCGTVAENVLRHGTGAINVDGCRVGTESTVRVQRDSVSSAGWASVSRSPVGGSESGRWPANVIHDGSEEVVGLFPETASGSRKAGRHVVAGGVNAYAGGWCEGDMPEIVGDSGSAARFFYCAKASREDRGDNHHPTVKPTALMRYLCRLVTPPDGVVLDPFTGSGSTGKAAVLEGLRFIGIEREAEYVEIARARIAAAAGERPLLEAIA